MKCKKIIACASIQKYTSHTIHVSSKIYTGKASITVKCSLKALVRYWKDYLTDETMLLDSFNLDKFGT